MAEIHFSLPLGPRGEKKKTEVLSSISPMLCEQGPGPYANGEV